MRTQQAGLTLSTRAMPWTAVVLLVGLALAPSAARANDPAVKDLLGKAQSQSDTKAVEDLIGKLQSRAKPKAEKPAEPAAAGKDAATQMPAAETTKRPAAAAGAAPKAAEPEAPVKTAEAEPMPSVDLEVLFEYNSARIAPAALPTLTTLGRALADARLAQDSFLIAGHTDAKGGAAFNLRLSQRRAESVRKFLVDTSGIDARRLVAKGFGQQRLKDAADPLAAVNRRVQIVNFTPPKAP